jgi:hypothetical protein
MVAGSRKAIMTNVTMLILPMLLLLLLLLPLSSVVGQETTAPTPLLRFLQDLDTPSPTLPPLNGSPSSPTGNLTNSTASDFPSSVPTMRPSISPAPSFPPSNATTESDAPSDVPTASPTAEATERPSDVPTAVPTAAPTVPEGDPTKEPTTKAPTTEEPTTEAPVTATEAPTGTRTRATVDGVAVKLTGVQVLKPDDLAVFLGVTRTWFEEFFNGVPADNGRLLAFGDGIDSIPYLSTKIIFSQQTTEENSSGVNVTRVVYNQRLTYEEASGAVLEPEDIVRLPFEDETANRELVKRLRATDESTAFRRLSGTIPVPSVNTVIPPIVRPDDGDDGGFPQWAIYASAGGGGFLLLLLVVALVWRRGRSSASAAKTGVPSIYQQSYQEGPDIFSYDDEGNERPPASFNISASEDVSTIHDGYASGQNIPQRNSLEYGDQRYVVCAPALAVCTTASDTCFSSVATVDYDYSKAYGGAGDTSVISSSGGTFGDNTQPTAGEVAASTLAARQALGASFDSEAQFREEVREEVLVIDAPPGKLGVVIDTPDDGAPVVHAVKDSSVIAHMIQVGDKLVAVDETDVRSMTAIKVSKLISRKSANPSRKLTVVRTSLLGHP